MTTQIEELLEEIERKEAKGPWTETQVKMIIEFASESLVAKQANIEIEDARNDTRKLVKALRRAVKFYQSARVDSAWCDEQLAQLLREPAEKPKLEEKP